MELSQQYDAFTWRELGVKIFQEETALVHYGHRKNNIDSLSLVDIAQIDNIDTLDYLGVVQPDFMLFRYNKFLWNEKETRIAGYPDLIVEVWSQSDSKQDREAKFLIYSNSNNKTEHWYLEQDSNIISCFMGKHKLQDKRLNEAIASNCGVTFDLTHVQI